MGWDPWEDTKDFAEDTVNSVVDFTTDYIGTTLDIATLGVISDSFIDEIKGVSTWEDAYTTYFTAGLYTSYDELEDDIKGVFEQVFPSIDESSMMALSELNVKYMTMETEEQIRRLGAEFGQEMGYVRAVQASSGLSVNSASFVADRTERAKAFDSEISWLRTALESRIEIERAETIMEIDILDQQMTSSNIQTGMGILDLVI